MSCSWHSHWSKQRLHRRNLVSSRSRSSKGRRRHGAPLDHVHFRRTTARHRYGMGLPTSAMIVNRLLSLLRLALEVDQEAALVVLFVHAHTVQPKCPSIKMTCIGRWLTTVASTRGVQMPVLTASFFPSRISWCSWSWKVLRKRFYSLSRSSMSVGGRRKAGASGASSLA